jgi:putative addiction module killer protein
VIVRRIARVAAGNFGDVRPVGGGVSELRIDHGPGFRVYFVRRGASLVVLLCGGDKGSQARDIARAKVLAEEV